MMKALTLLVAVAALAAVAHGSNLNPIDKTKPAPCWMQVGVGGGDGSACVRGA